MLIALIGIGSNSTRMLIADIAAGEATPVKRFRHNTRLMDGLVDGNFTAPAMMEIVKAVAALSIQAQQNGAALRRIIATSAMRNAGNAQALCDMIHAACDVPVDIISGEEEARLSFVGSAGVGFAGMVDLGGGSTEIAIGGGGRPLRTASTELGARRFMRQMPSLAGDDFDAALSFAHKHGESLKQIMHENDRPNAWFGVGGTLSGLASLVLAQGPYSEERVENMALTLSDVQRFAKLLASMTEEERANMPGMMPHRTDIIAHGAVALAGIMETLSIQRIVVTGRTNLDGIAREYAGEITHDSVDTVRQFYDASVESEWERMERNYFEFEINKRYIDRYTRPGDRVLDVGGGPGRYSLHMAQRGTQPTLVDLSPANIAFATQKAAEAGLSFPAIACDARDLSAVGDDLYDAVLLMGPLYHLLTEADRVRAVQQCLARLKPDGVFIASFISTIGGMIYAAREVPESIDWDHEDGFYEKVIAGDDFAGAAFTQTFFIDPSHVDPFMAQFPLAKLHLLGSEGITAPFHGQMATQPPEVRAKWLALSLALCERESFYSYAEHLLYIGRKEA